MYDPVEAYGDYRAEEAAKAATEKTTRELKQEIILTMNSNGFTPEIIALNLKLPEEEVREILKSNSSLTA